jgi:hypothetical protein
MKSKSGRHHNGLGFGNWDRISLEFDQALAMIHQQSSTNDDLNLQVP